MKADPAVVAEATAVAAAVAADMAAVVVVAGAAVAVAAAAAEIAVVETAATAAARIAGNQTGIQVKMPEAQRFGHFCLRVAWSVVSCV